MSDLNGISVADCRSPLHPRAIDGLELFNLGQYWRAHEALEAAWREESGPIRELYRGILQAAVVYLHVSRNNYAGAIKVYERCLRWLKPWPDQCRGVEVGLLRQDLGKVIQEIILLGPDRMTEFDLSLLKPVSYARI
jgi:predicted metal-dependent hydrolase